MGSRPLNIRRKIFAVALLLGAFLGATQLLPTRAYAASGVNQQINFQGRLLNSQGATVPDGFYNIQFKIYQDGDGQSVGNTTGSPAGTLKWTESYLNANTQGVTVKNGFLSVQLGTITPFGSNIDWNQDTLWLSMNIASTNGSCTPFTSCSPDGEMTPLKRLSATPYALNAGMLGGLTSAGFIQNTSTPQTANFSITGNGTIGGNILVAGLYNTNTFNANTLTFGDNLNPASITAGSGQALNLTGNAASTISTLAGSLSLSAAATQSILIGTINSNTITLGTTTASSTITVGRSSGSNTVSIASGNTSNGNTQTVNIATGTPTGTGNAQVNIGNTSNASAVNIYAGSGDINLNANVALGSAKTLTTTGTISTTTSVTGGTLASTTATGTAPITVNSTTKVTNLNADLLDGLDSTAFAAASGSTSYIQNGTTTQTANFNIVSAVASSVGALIQGAANATQPVLVVKGGATPSSGGDLVQYQDSTGAVLSRVTAAGHLALNATTSAAQLSVVTDAVGTVGTVIKGKSGQTADLAQFQDNNGVILQKTDANGGLTTYGSSTQHLALLAPTFITGSTGTTYYYVITSTNAVGETVASPSLGMSNNTPNLTWSQVNGATGYKIYRNTSNAFTSGSLLLTTITNGATLNYTDSGSVTTAGLPPTALVGSGLTIQTWSAQTAPALQIQNGSGTPIFNIAQSSQTYIGVGGAANNSRFTVNAGLATNVGQAIKGASSQTADLFELLDSSNNVNSAFNGSGNQLTLGRIAASGTVTQGQLVLSDGTADNFGTTLKSATLTTGSQTIIIPDTAGAGGTVCLQNSASCGFLTGSAASYIQNGTSQQASSNFNISGTGTAATSIVTPLLDTATGVPLNIGTGTASAVNIARSGVTTAVGGALTTGSTINSATISGGSLSSAAVNGLNVSSTAIAVSAVATNFTVDAGTTGTVSIGGVSSGNVLLGGGSGATGCTINNGNGNFDCSGTINGATLSGGTLSGGSVTGGTLSATTVNGLNLSSTALSVAAAATNLSLDAGTTGTINIGNTSTGNILLGGGNGATGCTVTNATGNFACTGTLNGATISGGTLSSGSFSGATVSGGTLSAGTFSGGSVSGGSLTAAAVNGLNVGATSVAVSTSATNLTVDAGTTGTISLGSTSTGDILLAGGSASTGCTVVGATGNIICSGTVNGATISGGTLSGGSFTGGSVSAGTFTGGTVSGGSLSASAVNGLNLSATAIAVSAAATSLTLDAGTTGNVSIGGTSTGNVLIAGGLGATGCTVNNGNGNFNCDGTINGATVSGGTLSGGTVSGGTLTATAVNSLLVGANALSTASGALAIDANGINAISLGSTSTGDILLGGGSGATGCTVTNSNGNLVCTGTINGATVSGGTLSAGSFTGGNVSGGTLSAGTFSGGSVSGGSLTASAVNGLNVGASSVSVVAAATNLTIDAGTTGTISLGSTSSGDILLAGGSASTGCTVVGATGNIICSGTVNGATISGGSLSGGSFTGGAVSAGTLSGGTVSGGTLSATAVNSLNVSGTAIAGTGALTIDANTTNTISIGGVSIGNVLLAGGLGASGCTVNNGNGNLNCDGTINGATFSGGTFSGGTVSGGTLTATAVNSLLVGANAIATASGNLSVDASGIGTVNIGGSSTGDVTLAGGSGATGCTITNASGNLTCTGTLNGATISGGTLSAGSFTGGNVSGGTLSAGTFSGGAVSGGSLTATAVNSLNVSGTAISGTGALTIDASGATSISLGNTSTGDILFGGGSASTGCTVVNATGNIICSGTVNGATVSGGTLSGGSFTGGSVSAGTFSGGTVSGGSLSATAVNGLNLSATAIAVSAAATGLTLDAGTTGTVSIGGTSTGNVLIAGGLGATGCTVNNGNGNFNCDGTINGATVSGGTLSGGTVSGGSLSATAVNSLNIGANAISTASGAFTIDANGANTISLGSTSTGDILLGGGSASTGCTVINASGNFACTGTLNGATISGGTLSAGSFTGGNVSGGTLSAGTFSGGAVSGGSLTATAVNSLNLGANAISTASGALAIDANGTNTISIGSGSTGDILIGGGSASTGCTVTNISGNLVCTGTINGATLSAGTLSGGTFSGGSVASGSYAGATVTGGTLSATAVNGLNVSAGAVAVAAAATNFTVDAGTTGTISLGATSTGNILFAGGLGATGCTVNNGNGNFNCDGTLNGATISGGTLSGGSVTGGTLTATTVNTLIIGGNTVSTAAGNLALDAFGAGTINIGASSTGDVTLAGGSGATGCTVINASGNFACTGTVNGATISGGTLTSGSYSGATITGGTLSAGTFSGGTVSGGSLTTTAVNGLNVGTNSISTTTGNLAIDANAAGTISIGGGSTGDILLAGGNAGTGCTITNTNGNLACTGQISAGNGLSVAGNSFFQTSSNSASGFVLQNSGSFNVMTVDTSTNTLKIFDGTATQSYISLSYNDGTTTGTIAVSNGTTAIGSGTGAVTVIAGSGSAVNITGNATSLWKTTAGTLTLQSGTASDLILTSGSGIVSVSGASVTKLGSSAGDPGTCTAGAVVYNTTTNTLRGCQGGSPTWNDLINLTTPTMQQTYTASTGGTTPEVKLDVTRGAFDLQGDNAGTVATILNVRAGTGSGLGASLLSVSNAGNVAIQSSTGIAELSTTAIDITIGSGNTPHATNPVVLVLDNYQPATAGSEPTEQDGAMYYDASSSSFRCGNNAFWQNCAINNIESSYVFEDEFLGGQTQTAAATSVANVGSLGWNVNTTTSCAVAYNQNVAGTGPGIVHDHPGTLRLTTGNAAASQGCVMNQGGSTLGTSSLNQIIAGSDVFKSAIAIGAATGTMRVGWSNMSAAATAPQSGLWWQYTGGNLQYCYANHTTAICATATTLAANIWAEVEIHINNNTSNSVTFTSSIGGIATTNTIVSTFDPGSTNPLSPGASCVTTTTTAQNCYVDYIQWSGFNQSGTGTRD